MNVDHLLHVFATFMGMPPDTDTPPVCGATLSRAYNGRNAPHCPVCDRILAEHTTKRTAARASVDGREG